MLRAAAWMRVPAGGPAGLVESQPQVRYGAHQLEHRTALKQNQSSFLHPQLSLAEELGFVPGLADLEGEEEITPAHVAEAVQYRGLDREM